MATVRVAWGIDIGNRALKAVKLVRTAEGIRVDDFEVIEHEHVLSQAGDNREALIESAVTNFVQRHAVKGIPVGVGVSGVSSFARFIKLPPVEKKKIPEIVKFEAIQQIPFPLADVEWNYQLFQAPDSPEVEVGIFAMRRELVNAHLRYFTTVDLNVQVVQTSPLAVYNAMYYDGQFKGTTMIVDLGAENTDLIIASGETIWMRSIPIGGNNFTEVLVKSFKLPFDKAEDLKRNANTSKYARQIFQAMRPVFADLAAEIQRSIGFYASVRRDAKIARIIAVGGAFRLAGLQKYLQQNLQMEVDKLGAFAAGAPADAKVAVSFNQNLLSLVGAYGLAVQTMGEAKITSSLLPMKIRRAKMWKDKTKIFGAAAAGFVLAAMVAAGGYWIPQIGYNSNDAVRTSINNEVQAAQTLSSAWTSQVEQAGAQDRQNITNVQSILDERDTLTRVYSDIWSCLPAPPPGYLEQNRDQLKATSRPDRKLVLIDRISSQYSADLASSAAADKFDLGSVTQPPPTDIPPGSHGYVITLSVTTPHDDAYLFLSTQALVPALKKTDRAAMVQYNTTHPKDPKNYFFTKVSWPVTVGFIKDDRARLQQMEASYQAAVALAGGNANAPAAPGAPAGAGGQAGGGAAVLPAFLAGVNPNIPPADFPFLDHVTLEDTRNDSEMRVEFYIVVDPPPAVPVPPAAATPGK